jgi:hypothetical protein
MSLGAGGRLPIITSKLILAPGCWACSKKHEATSIEMKNTVFFMFLFLLILNEYDEK